ncbi:MAG: hypothetical protein IPJ77_22205 [Planctomycetes bacterium]|nr:hypothetical protein [Planctomycetota bacterium]
MRALPSNWVALAILLAPSIAFAQSTWHVDASATPPGLGTIASPYSDLQYALAQPSTVSGDTLLVAPGTYTGAFDFLGKDVLVQSTAGAATTILDGGLPWPPVTPDFTSGTPVVAFRNGEGPGAVLDGFTVQHGRGSRTTTGLSLARGSGVFVSGASPTLRNLVVRENLGNLGVGMFFEGSSSSVSECLISTNTGNCYCSDIHGLGIYCTSAIIVDGCTITGNGPLSVGFAANQGAGVNASAGTFTNCVLSNNHGYWGAGAYLGGTATLVDCVISNNWSGSIDGDPGRGGGAFGGTLTRCVIENNYGGHAGGGTYLSNLVDCIVRGNSMRRPSSSAYTPVGGAGCFGGSLLRCDVYENTSGWLGHPVFAPNSGADGGGVHSATATSCRIHDNTAYAMGGTNGGLIGFGGAGAAFSTLVDCDVFDNEVLPISISPVPAICGGAGLYGGTATRCRIFGNTAPNAAGAANATLVNCTVTQNTATVAGGGVGSLDLPSATMTVRNSIVWGNSAPETTSPIGTLSITWSDVAGGAPGTGNIALDPSFQSAANRDFHLLGTSPCIDSGNPAELDPNGSRVDMGAYPFECGAHNYCVGKENSLGCVPSAAFTGTPDLSGLDDFHVTCANVRKNTVGLLLWSRASDAAPFNNGTLCVASTIIRTPVQSSGGTGVGPNCTGAFDFFFSHAYLNARAIVPFETIFAQWYMRDAAHPDGTGVGLSDGVAFTVCP